MTRYDKTESARAGRPHHIVPFFSRHTRFRTGIIRGCNTIRGSIKSKVASEAEGRPCHRPGRPDGPTP